MATLQDLREIASTLPGTVVSDAERFGLSVVVNGKPKGYVWAWAERVDPKKPRVVNQDVMAVVVPSLSAKDVLLQSDSGDKLFTEPHYNGFPAVLVRLARIDRSELEDLVIEAWRCKAPKALVKAYDARLQA